MISVFAPEVPRSSIALPMPPARSPILLALGLVSACSGGVPGDLPAMPDLLASPDLARVVITSDPATWGGGGDPADYEFTPDYSTLRDGVATGHIKAKNNSPASFASVASFRKPGVLAGQRVRYSAEVRSSGVIGWAGMWMRVDDAQQKPIAFDNMMDRPITGTRDWTRYEIVLDVATDAAQVTFGLLLSGPGEVWIGRATLEVVDGSVPTTGR